MSTPLPECKTVSVPEAGKIFGFSEKYSYVLASKGDIPTIRVGGRLRVPVREIEKMLKIKPAA